MHCTACETELTDFESTRKYSDGSYIDLCNICYGYIADDVDSNVRYDLIHETDTSLPVNYIASDADYIESLNIIIDNDE